MKDQAQLLALLMATVRRWEIPGLAVGAVLGDEVIFAEALGVQNTETRVPVTLESIFCVASVSKCFVATAIMQLLDRGQLDLDAPVVEYLPYFRMADERYQQISTRQLLSHTSGLPDLDEFEYNDLVACPETDEGAAERHVRGLSGRRLVAAPGERFSYSNIGYNLLGDLLAKLSGEPFETVMRERILMPSGMPDSTFLLADVPSARLAVPHLRSPEVRPGPIYPYHRADAPASFLHSTVVDMCHWAITTLNRGVFLGASILSPAAYGLMWTPTAQWGQQHPSIYEDMALGWTLGHFKGFKTISHGGMGFGWSDFLLVLPEQNCGIVMLCNGESFARMRIVRAIADVLIGEQPAHEPVSWMVPISHALAGGGISAARACYEDVKARATGEYYFDPDDLTNLALQLFSARKLDLAVDVLELNVQVFPEHMDSYIMQAELHLRQGNLALAAQAIDTASGLEAGNPRVVNLLERLRSRTAA